ncbi:MAG TPA: DUF2807 domain-containing protein [Polyangia bacterium]|jgi:hypothetical protein
MSGSGTLRADELKGDRIEATLDGSGTLELGGEAASLALTVGGSGAARARGLAAASVAVSVAGSGSATVCATAELQASVTGGGDIVYGCDPEHVTRGVTGSGALTAE